MTETPKPHSVNWEAASKSLDWEDDMRRMSANTRRLRQRAQQYAAPVAAPSDLAENSFTVLSFDLGAETYSVDVALVRNVRAITNLVRVPGLPPFYPGVVNVRGQIVTVMDLRPFFGISVDEEVIVPDEMVLVRANSLEIALLAHQVNGVVTVSQRTLSHLDNLHYTRGITRNKMIMLDIERLLADERIIVGGKHD
jgi:purine-binding chemotaxis protein CheW